MTIKIRNNHLENIIHSFKPTNNKINFILKINEAKEI